MRHLAHSSLPGGLVTEEIALGDGTWNFGLPNACSAFGEMLAICRGSSVDVLDWSVGAPQYIHRFMHTSAIEQVCVVGAAVYVLDNSGGVWKKTDLGSGFSPVFQEPGFRQIAPWGLGVAGLTDAGVVVVEGQGTWALPPVADLLPAPAGYAAVALPDGLVKVLRDGMEVGALQVTRPRCVVRAAGRVFVVAYEGTLLALDGGADIEIGAPVIAAWGAGGEVVCSTLSGLVRCRLGDNGVSLGEPDGRPARSFTGNTRVWAVYDDELAQLFPDLPDPVRLTFDTPQAAAPIPSGLAVTGRSGSYLLSLAGESSRHVLSLPPGSDVLWRDGYVITGWLGAVSGFGLEGHTVGPVQVGQGQSCALRLNRWDGTLGVALDWSVHVLDGLLCTLHEWQADFTPLCAVWMGDRAFIAAGEDGLYVADDGGMRRVSGLGLEAVLDVCAVSPTEIAVATGAGVVKLACGDESRAVSRLAVPGVRSIDCADGILAALTDDSLLRVAADTFRLLSTGRLRNDGKLVRVGNGRIAICGYDSVEVEIA
ncbi:MAG: hypothetical protein JWM19_5321 [Actinomycetia bacterium]|nr:hypothetical protein [Actinomycetes bacterium]